MLGRSSHAVVFGAAALMLAALGASAAELSSTVALHQKLLPTYQAVRANSQLLAMDPGLHGQMSDAAAMDRFLKAMPLSPLEYLQIDMEARRYEIAVPKYLQEAHVRWIELNEKVARDQYGDGYVDAILTRWPVDTGNDVVNESLLATVGTNRNVAATAVPPAT
ncbi:MAG TPA: hypothetical protein PK413_15170, partial [Thermoanaerobaculia bacterium]|nr:hypothetical protein [Thermoanaerobaculia bacterium]